MSEISAERRIVFVHAHPDDETIGTGATMARYAAESAHVTLVTCTRGEEGEVLVPHLVHLAAAHTDTLGEHRESELAAAMRQLGVTDHRFLGGGGRWRDSGMMGLPTNERVDAFWRANLLEAASELVTVIREVRPQVLVTYDDDGGYGHPDHIQSHRVATYAVALAAVPSFRSELGGGWDVPKVYWTALPKSAVQEGIDALVAAGGKSFFGLETVDDLPFAISDELVSTCVDGRAFGAAKMQALRQHATQVEHDGEFFALSNTVGPESMGYEHFRIAKGEVAGERDDRGWETDLFAGVAP